MSFIANSRNLGDGLLRAVKALPAANASNNSDSIDLGPGFKGENFELELSVPATPALVDAKTVTFTFKDSADDVTFAAIPELAPLVTTGAGGAGAAAASRRVRIPSSCRRYVRVDAAVLAAGGDNTTVSYTLKVLL